MRAIGLLTLTSIAAIGCNGKDGKGESGDLVAVDANNYSYAGELTLDTIAVEAGSDLTIDWSAVTVDVRGRPLDPTTVQQVAILGVPSPLAETISLIEKNELDATQDAALYDNAGGTSAVTSDFSAAGNPFDYSVLTSDPDKTWLVSLLNVDGGSTDLLMSAVFVPTVGAGTTTIALGSDSAALAVDVDFHSAPAIVTSADAGPYTLDWTEVTTDVFGHTFQALKADELIIARYDTEDVGEIEAGFLQLDENAVEIYEADVRGITAIDLDEAEDADGTAFPGFTTEGTWLVGLLCSECITPVPLFLSIVEVK